MSPPKPPDGACQQRAATQPHRYGIVGGVPTAGSARLDRRLRVELSLELLDGRAADHAGLEKLGLERERSMRRRRDAAASRAAAATSRRQSSAARVAGRAMNAARTHTVVVVDKWW